MKEPKLKIKKEGDYVLLALTMMLALFGLVMVFSASYYAALSKFGDPYHYLLDDAMWKAIGIVLFIITANLDYHYYRLRFLPEAALIFGIVLLCLIFTPLGLTINHATRWLDFKVFTVMPGEVIKSCLIIFIADFYTKDPSKIRSFKRGILPIVLIAGVCGFLIMKQPNLSTAGIVVLMVIGMMFVAGLQWRYILLAGGGLGGLFITIINMPQFAYMRERVEIAFDPFRDSLGSGYQPVQSILALSSGGLTGVGIGHSIQKTFYLPEPQSDYILAIIGEELGFIGLVILIIVYLALIWRSISTAIRAKDYYGMMLAAGISLHLSLQVILNIAVVSASFFPTGVVLPFISLGGNATCLMLAEMGVLFNISRGRLDTLNSQQEKK